MIKAIKNSLVSLWKRYKFSRNARNTLPAIYYKDGEQLFQTPDVETFFQIANERGLDVFLVNILEPLKQSSDGIWEGLGEFEVFSDSRTLRAARPDLIECSRR